MAIRAIFFLLMLSLALTLSPGCSRNSCPSFGSGYKTGKGSVAKNPFAKKEKKERKKKDKDHFSSKRKVKKEKSHGDKAKGKKVKQKKKKKDKVKRKSRK